MKRIINAIKDFLKTHRKSLIISAGVLMSFSVVSGVFIYNNSIQNKKEKELLSRIDNLEEQVKKEDKLSEKGENDTNSVDSKNKETETGRGSVDVNTKGEVGAESNGTVKDNANGGINTNVESDELVVLSSNGIKGINYGRFGECLTVVSLTIDNWREYIDVLTYNEEFVRKDEFGEVISSGIATNRVLGVKTNKYYYFENCLIELKNVKTQATTIYSFLGKGLEGWGNKMSEDFNLNDYECTRIKGKIYFVDLPKEVIYAPLPEWGYACGFMIIGTGMESPYEIQKEIKRIYPNGAEDWEEKYMK